MFVVFRKFTITQQIPALPIFLGEPLSNATLGDDGIYRRSFGSGTKVTFDTNTETGTIEWGSLK